MYCFSPLAFSRPADCVSFDNNRIRCLAKKRCNWTYTDARGGGLCTYKDIPENAEEREYYKDVEAKKLKCLALQKKYKEAQSELLRAKIYGNTLVSTQKEKESKQLADEMNALGGCDVPSTK